MKRLIRLEIEIEGSEKELEKYPTGNEIRDQVVMSLTEADIKCKVEVTDEWDE